MILEATFWDNSFVDLSKSNVSAAEKKGEIENINFVKCYPTWLKYGLCCHKHLSRNINNAYLNISKPMKPCFFLKGIQQFGLITNQVNSWNSFLGKKC